MNNHQIQRQQIYLAALLHDIGKFWQRADDKDIDNTSVLNDHVKQNADNLTDIKSSGFIPHGHTLYTQQFFEDFSEKLKEIFSDINIDEVIKLSIYHHKPESNLESQLIQIADWWSSGIDRNQLYLEGKDDPDYRNRPLTSIWGNLNLDTNYHKQPQKENEANINKQYGYSLRPLSLNKEDIFPKSFNGYNNIDVNQQAYENLWKSFIEELTAFLKSLGNNQFRTFSDTLLFLLQKYLWCIPASTLQGELHDSSLYEHSKITAAIAICLYDYCIENMIESKDQLNNTTRPVQLVAIDISGIQSFIYYISNKGAAKSLKGRSFYIQLLTETIINELLYKLDYYRANVIYNSGGKAYLLLPNISKVNSELNNYQDFIEEWLYEKFQGEIYVSIAQVPFFIEVKNPNETKYLIGNSGTSWDENQKYSTIENLWKSVLEETGKKKNQRFRSIIKKSENFFEPFGVGGTSRVCDLTGVELNDTEYYKLEDNLEEYYFSIPVAQQIELGKVLKNTDYYVWCMCNTIHLEKLDKSSFKQSSLKYLEILNSKWLFYSKNNKISSFDEGIIYKVIKNEFDFICNTIPGNSVKTYKFYAGTVSEELNTFEALLPSQDLDFKQLGVLVLDVDNLGKIFVEGLKYKVSSGHIIERSSFSRIATLSFYLDLFFSGYVNKLKEKYPNVIVVYSGGDDMLAVGFWEQIIDFAKNLRDEFFEYVCQRSEISFSAGICLFKPKFPISKAVEIAKEAEDEAKSYNNGKKGAIGFLGEVLEWRKSHGHESDFDFVYNVKEKLLDYFDKGAIYSSFIQHLQVLYEAMKESEKTGRLNYIWYTSYFIQQYKKRYEKLWESKNLKEVEEFLEKMKKELLNSHMYKLYAIASRWAELIIRNKK